MLYIKSDLPLWWRDSEFYKNLIDTDSENTDEDDENTFFLDSEQITFKDNISSLENFILVFKTIDFLGIKYPKFFVDYYINNSLYLYQEFFSSYSTNKTDSYYEFFSIFCESEIFNHEQFISIYLLLENKGSYSKYFINYGLDNKNLFLKKYPYNPPNKFGYIDITRLEYKINKLSGILNKTLNWDICPGKYHEEFKKGDILENNFEKKIKMKSNIVVDKGKILYIIISYTIYILIDNTIFHEVNILLSHNHKPTFSKNVILEYIKEERDFIVTDKKYCIIDHENIKFDKTNFIHQIIFKDGPVINITIFNRDRLYEIFNMFYEHIEEILKDIP